MHTNHLCLNQAYQLLKTKSWNLSESPEKVEEAWLAIDRMSLSECVLFISFSCWKQFTGKRFPKPAFNMDLPSSLHYKPFRKGPPGRTLPRWFPPLNLPGLRSGKSHSVKLIVDNGFFQRLSPHCHPVVKPQGTWPSTAIREGRTISWKNMTNQIKPSQNGHQPKPVGRCQVPQYIG